MKARVTPIRLVIALAATAQLAALVWFWVQASGLALIAHASGSVEGQRMTNSLAAMDASLAAGFTLIEIDLHRLSDGTVVCAHDWDDFGGAAPTPDAWRASLEDTPPHLRPCTASTAGAWLRANPDAVIVTDVKADLTGVLDDLAAMGWPRDRMLVQIYAPEQAGMVRDLGFERRLISLHLYRGPIDPVLRLVRDGEVEAVTMPERMVARGLARRFSGMGVPIYTHTVNGWVAGGIHALRGVDGVYTDNTQARAPHPFARGATRD